MTDFAKLILTTDATGLTKGEEAMGKLAVAAGRTEGAVQDVTAATRALAPVTGRLDASVISVGRGLGGMGYQARLAAQQLSQVGQQTMASGNFVQALAIQLPDLGLAFGVVGAAAGLVAGIALPLLVRAFSGAGAEVKTLDEAMGDLKGSLASYETWAKTAAATTAELSEEFGIFAADLKAVSEFMAEVSLGKVRDDLSAALVPIKDGLADVESAMAGVADMQQNIAEVARQDALGIFIGDAANMSLLFADAMGVYQDNAEEAAAALGLTAAQATEFAAAIDAIFSDQGGGNAEIVRDAAAASAALDSMVASGMALTPEMKEIQSAIAVIARDFAKTETAITTVEEETAAIVTSTGQAVGLYTQLGNIGWWAADASRDLAYNTARAADYAAAVAANGGGIRGVLLTAADAAWELYDGLVAAMGTLPGIASGMITAVGLDWLPDAVANVAGAAISGFKAAAGAVSNFASSIGTTRGGRTGAAGGVADLADEMTVAEQAALDFADAMQGEVKTGIESVVDWLVDGFDGGLATLWDIFTGTIKDMIAFALKNKITIAMGFGGATGAAMAGDTAALGLVSNGAATGIGALTDAIGGGFMDAIAALTGGISTGGLSGIAAAIGAAILPLGALAATFSLLFGRTTQLDAGLRLTASGMDLLVDQYTTTQTSRLFGLIKTTNTGYTPADAALSDPLQAAYADIYTGVTDMAAAIGLGSEALAGFTYSMNVSTKGLTDAEATAALQAEFDAMASGMADLVLAGEPVVKLGETSADALTRLSTSLTGANAAMTGLGGPLFDISVEGAAAASAMVEVLGSIEDFTAGMDYYFANFYSAGEQAVEAARQFDTAVSGMGLAAIDTEAQFRAAVDAMLASGDATGAAALIALAPLFDSMIALENAAAGTAEVLLTAAEIEAQRYSLETQLLTVQGDTVELRARELAVLDPANRALQEEIWALEDMEAAALDAAAAQESLAAEQYDLYTQLYTLQGKTGQLRARELELLDPANQALQERVWALEDAAAAEAEAVATAEAMADAAQGVADERYGLETQLLELQGDTTELRARELNVLDESNRALQEQIWLLEDQKAALEALDPEAFSSLFEFQRASALAANGYAVANSNAPPAPAQGPPVPTVTSATDPMVIALNKNTAEIILFRIEQRDLAVQVASNTLSSRNTLTKWDGDGMPKVRT